MKLALLFLIAVSLGSEATIPNVPLSESVNGSTPQTRTVNGRTLTSTQLPAVRLEFSKPFKYAGGHSFILYEVANAEQHFFVDADKDGRVKRHVLGAV